MNKELVQKVDDELLIHISDSIDRDRIARLTINLCADEAIDAVNSEQLTDDVDCPSDTAYTNALDCASDWPSSLTVLTKRVKIVNVNNFQNKTIFMTLIQVILKIIVLIAIGWLSLEAIFHIGEHGLKHLIDTIWLGNGNG